MQSFDFVCVCVCFQSPNTLFVSIIFRKKKKKVKIFIFHKYSTGVPWKLQVYTDERHNKDTLGLKLAVTSESFKKGSPFLDKRSPSAIGQTVNLK